MLGTARAKETQTFVALALARAAPRVGQSPHYAGSF